MNEIYEKELNELRLKMENSENLAKIFPCFSERILRTKQQGINEEFTGNCKYELRGYFGCSITRHIFTKESCMGMYKGKIPNRPLFRIYINSWSLFECYEEFGLNELEKCKGVFFWDNMNSTFYIEDDYICDFFEELQTWYKKAKTEAVEYKLNKEISEAQEKLNKLKENSK